MLRPENIRYGAAGLLVAIAVLFGGETYPEQAGSVLFFSASWCKFCQRFKPEWRRFQVMAGGKYKTAEVPEGDPLGQAFGVRGYPTIVLVDAKGKRHDYDGPRTAEGLLAFTETVE